MLTRRTPHRLVAAVALVLLAAPLAACGGRGGHAELGFDSISVSGPVGQAPTIRFSGKVTDATPLTKVSSKAPALR